MGSRRPTDRSRAAGCRGRSRLLPDVSTASSSGRVPRGRVVAAFEETLAPAEDRRVDGHHYRVVAGVLGARADAPGDVLVRGPVELDHFGVSPTVWATVSVEASEEAMKGTSRSAAARAVPASVSSWSSDWTSMGVGTRGRPALARPARSSGRGTRRRATFVERSVTPRRPARARTSPRSRRPRRRTPGPRGTSPRGPRPEGVRGRQDGPGSRSLAPLVGVSGSSPVTDPSRPLVHARASARATVPSGRGVASRGVTVSTAGARHGRGWGRRYRSRRASAEGRSQRTDRFSPPWLPPRPIDSPERGRITGIREFLRFSNHVSAAARGGRPNRPVRPRPGRCGSARAPTRRPRPRRSRGPRGARRRRRRRLRPSSRRLTR